MILSQQQTIPNKILNAATRPLLTGAMLCVQREKGSVKLRMDSGIAVQTLFEHARLSPSTPEPFRRIVTVSAWDLSRAFSATRIRESAFLIRTSILEKSRPISYYFGLQGIIVPHLSTSFAKRNVSVRKMWCSKDTLFFWLATYTFLKDLVRATVPN